MLSATVAFCQKPLRYARKSYYSFSFCYMWSFLLREEGLNARTRNPSAAPASLRTADFIII
jgi:hypothetical protein